MSDRDEALQETVADLATALQAAAPLAMQQTRVLGSLAHDAATLEAAVERAVRAVRCLRPTETETGGEQ